LALHTGKIAIPDHHPLRLGTFASILRTVAPHKGVKREAIIANFVTQLANLTA
jgi:hypothetical protein